MSGHDKMHLIGDRHGRVRNIDVCAEGEPTTTWPYMLWIKPSTGAIKVRNAADTGWVSVGGNGGGGAPIDAQYLVLALHGDLTAERRLVAGDGLDLTDGGAGGDATLDVDAADLAGTGLEENAGNLRIAAAAAGDGLQGGGGSALSVDVSDFAGDGLQDDGSENLEVDSTVSRVADGVTKTVKAAGGDFTTIQGAIDWFKDYIIKGACKIEVDAGTYDEAVTFADLIIAPGASLELEGDTRALVGLSYVDGASMNQVGLANCGSGTCGLSNAGNNITVTGSSTNPNFASAGIVNGDKVITLNNAGTIAIYTVSSVSSNTITLTGTAPALGNDGTAIGLMPNRAVDRTSQGPCIAIPGTKGVIVDGFYLNSHTGTRCDGIQVSEGGLATAENILSYAEDGNFYGFGDFSTLKCSDGACSGWGGTYGFWAYNLGYCLAAYGVAVKNSSRGFFASYFACTVGTNGIATEGSIAFAAQYFAFMRAQNGTARQNTIGYYAGYTGFVYAYNTSGQNNGNGTNYSPAPALPGSAQGNHYGVMYAS